MGKDEIKKYTSSKTPVLTNHDKGSAESILRMVEPSLTGERRAGHTGGECSGQK